MERISYLNGYPVLMHGVAIWVSSLYGMARIDCAGFREKCQEAGLGDILLYIGGILVTGPVECLR